jgi:hypothetical protein
LAISLAMMVALTRIGLLRVSADGEIEGLDVHEHGAAAYPEFVLTGVGGSSATPRPPRGLRIGSHAAAMTRGLSNGALLPVAETPD